MSTAGLSGERLITQLEMHMSTESFATPAASRSSIYLRVMDADDADFNAEVALFSKIRKTRTYLRTYSRTAEELHAQLGCATQGFCQG